MVMVKTRVITALMMLVVVGGLVFFASFKVWFVAISIMLAWSAVEWAGLANFSKIGKAVYAFALPALFGAAYAFVLPAFMQGMGVYSTGAPLSFYPLALLSALAACAFWLFVAPLWLYFGWHVRTKWVLALVGGLLLLTVGFCLMWLRPSPAQAPVLLGLLLVIWLADSAAFFTGRAFGRRKLAPMISPGKTLEGAAGAWVGVTVYFMVLAFGLHYLPGTLSAAHLLVLAFLLTYISVLGDLFESWLKRCAGVKDSGQSLPGHGGILDRIDAILSTLPLQVVLIAVFGLAEAFGL
jgi:phosphatidate cytidylyltransferase